MEEKDPYIVEKPTGLDAFLKDLESNPFKPAPYPFQTNFSDQAIAEPTTAEPFDFSKVNNTENSENNISNAFRSAAKGKDKLQAEYADSNIFKRFNNREVSVQDLGIDQDQLEYKYANTQSFLERSMNDIRAGGANAGATFVAGFLALPDIFNTIKNGVEFTPSESVIAVDAWRKEVEENNTNFKTAIDDETGVYNTLKNILLPGFMTGSSKGWGELFKSTMYGVGAGAAFVVQEGIATLIPGVGNAAVAANTVARTLNATKNFGQMVKLGDTVLKTSLGFNRLKNSLIVADKLTDATKWTYRALIGSYGEAAFEGLESRHVLKETLIDNFRAKHGYAPSASQLKEIEKTADDASNARFLGNMALLGVTQTYQLNRLFKQFDLAKETYDEIAKRGKKLGLDEAGAPVVKELLDATKWYNSGVGKFAKDGSRRIVETFTEGAEEFTQGVIADATDRYYTYKIDHRGRADINDAFRATKEGFKDNLNTEGLRNFVTGAFAGYAQSILLELGGKGYQKAAGTYKNEKDIQDKALEESISYAEDFDFKTQVAAFNVNSVRGTLTDRYMNANAASVGQMESDKALQANDKKVFKDIGTRTFFNSIESYIKRGHGDLLKEQMKFATDKHEGNISELFQGLSKSEFLLKYDSEIDKANLAYSSVVKAFKSPYKQGSSLDNAFNNVWVPEMAFMNYRLNDLVSRKESLQQELGLYFDEYKHFLTKDTFKEGMSHLKKRITQIQDGTSDVDLREKYIKAQSLFYNFNDLVKSSQSTSQQIQDKFLEFHDLYGDITNQYLNNAYDSFDLVQKDEVFNKTKDTVLIAKDIDKIKLGLKGYYKKDAFAMFIARYAKDYIAEAKKAKKAEKIEDKGGVKAVQKKVEDLRDKTDIGLEEAEYIILNTETDEEATKQAEELRQQEIIKVKLQSDKIRLVNDKFLIAGISDATSKFLQYNLAINDETVSVEDFEKIVDGFIKDSISQTTEEKVDEVKEKIKFLNNNFGKLVIINNNKGILTKINDSRFEVENSNTIFEFTLDDIVSYEAIIPEVSVKKYNITNLSETSVIVNGINYTINEASNGNIESLSPLNRPTQNIKNEALIISVEIERAKLDNYTENEKETVFEDLKNNYPNIDNVLNNIWDTGMTEKMAVSLDKLYDKIPLSEEESLGLAEWLQEVFERIVSLVDDKNSKLENETLTNAYNTAEIINSLLYNLNNLTTNKDENRHPAENVTEVEVAVSTKRTVEEIKTDPIAEIVIDDKVIEEEIKAKEEEIKIEKEEEPILTIEEEEEIVIKEVEILDELEESTLVSKFENRSFDPDVFNAEGLVRQEILDQFQTLKDYQDFIKSEAYNLIKHLVDNEKMSEQQLMAHILENSTLKYYTVDDAGENDIKIHKPYTVSRLAQEKVLRSETVNVVTLEYFDKSTGTNIFLQSYKEPFKSITFLTSNELVSVFEEAQTEIDAEIQSKINSVIGNDNISYYDFLKKVVQDEDARDVYNFLVEKKFLKFTTSPQNQLNLLKEKQKEWEALRDLRFQPLEGNVSFERHYIGFKSQPKFITRISDISHPYVQITDPQSGITRNKYVFFNYNKSLDGENQIKFIPAQTKDSADLRALIAKSFEAKSEKKGESLNGYYMLVSDSKQNKLAMGDDGKVHSFTIRLRGKKLVKIDPNTQLPEIDLATNESTIDWQQFIDTFKGTESNTVALVDYNFNGFSATLSRSIFENKPWDGKNVQLELDFQEGTREFRFTTVNFNLNDIEKTLANLSSAKTIQFEDKANTSTKKAFTDVKLNLVPVVSTGKEPTSAEDMMNTREAVGVGKENFLVSKFKPIFVVKEETQPVPFEAEFKQEKKDTRRDDIEREKQEELDKLKQGIPTMITQALRANLRQYFTDEQISHMTPIVANNNYIEAKYAEKLAALSVNDVINKPIEIQHISDEAISDMTQIIVAQTGYTNEEHIQAFIISAAVGYRNYRRTTNARTANDFEISLNPDFNVINKFLTKIYATQTFEKAKDLTSTAFTKNGNINFNLFTGSTPTLRVDESIEAQVQQLIIQCP